VARAKSKNTSDKLSFEHFFANIKTIKLLPRAFAKSLEQT
jgi:hypothetical protein